MVDFERFKNLIVHLQIIKIFHFIIVLIIHFI